MLHLHYGKILFSIRAANSGDVLWQVARAKDALKPWFQRAFLGTFVARDKSSPSETGQGSIFAVSIVSASAKHKIKKETLYSLWPYAPLAYGP